MCRLTIGYIHDTPGFMLFGPENSLVFACSEGLRYNASRGLQEMMRTTGVPAGRRLTTV